MSTRVSPPAAAATASSTVSPDCSFDIPDLTQPDDFTDVALVVGDRRLYTCRGILASASPVWRRMFTAGFREKDAGEIPLPGKNFEDMVELLLCVTPAIQKPISADNVLQVLPLSDEYQMKKQKVDCENFLLCQLEHVTTPTEGLGYLKMAQKYNLNRLRESSVGLVSTLSLEALEQTPEFNDLDPDILVTVLKRRVHSVEAMNRKLTQSAESWRRKHGELEDCLKKMSREKLTVKRTLDEMEGAWELKGSDARCIDPVHIYGPRNYSCEKCSRQVCTFLQSKVWFLLDRGSTRSGIVWPQ